MYAGNHFPAGPKREQRASIRGRVRHCGGRKVRIGELLHQRIDSNNRALLQTHLSNYQAQLKAMFPAEKLDEVSGRYKELLALTADDFVSH